MTMKSKFLGELTSAIVATNPMQRAFLDTSIHSMTDEEVQALEAYLNYCISTGQTVDYLGQCYDLIVKDTLREQFFFQKNKRYRYSTYAEVADSVYLNDEYMDKYMHGLAITSFLWPNHREMRRYFLQQMPKNTSGRYLEIGPGHGIYLLSAMQRTAYNFFEGVDISPKSIDLTRNVLDSGHFGKFENFDLYCRDFLGEKMAHQRYDAIVMGEVLEHVEDPAAFLGTIHTLAGKDSFIYITTCINAPAIDHIYLFDSVDSLEKLIESSGLSIVDKLVVPYENMSLEESSQKRMPVNVAYVLGA